MHFSHQCASLQAKTFQMRQHIYTICLFLFCTVFSARAQSTAFVLGGGPTIGSQRWDNTFERDPLFKYHFVIAAESVDNEEDKASVFAQLGYHVKGSATRFRYFVPGGNDITYKEEFLFQNLGLLLGAKQKFPVNPVTRLFYAGGIRGEYTLNTNLDELNDNNPYSVTYYPQDEFVRKFIFGVSVGGGTEWMLSELVGAQLTFWVHPDVTLQYSQPPIPNVIDPNNPGVVTSIPERRIRNIALEITLGLRLLRKVEYVD